MKPDTRIVILTGAGISAESGLGTFRDEGGVWTRYNLEDVATPEGFARNPAMVYEFYNQRRVDMLKSRANRAHEALARLEQALTARQTRPDAPEASAALTLVTQNVDNLHEQAGSQRVIHMHGELGAALCATCDWRGEWLDDMAVGTHCPKCADKGVIRPDVVWFGEMPYHMETIYERLWACDVFVSIGTSGQVYPAADFVREARMAGARTVELNLEASDNASMFDDVILGPASEVVPQWVDDVISGAVQFPK